MRKILTQYAGLKKEVYILFVGQLVTAMGSFVWPMLTFFLTTKLGMSDSHATFLIAIATTVMFPAALLGGRLADQFSKKNIIILFDLLTVFFYVLSAILPIGFHTAVFCFFAGMFQTMERPAYDALIADFSSTKQREKAFSLSYLGFNLGFIVGASVAGILFEKHTNVAFLVNGLSIFCSTVLIFFLVDPAHAIHSDEDMAQNYTVYEMPKEDSIGIMTILRERRSVLFILLISCLGAMTNNIVGLVLPLQLKNVMGISGAKIYGYLSSLNGLTVIAFTPVLTMLLKRITEIPKTVSGMLLFTAGMVMFRLGAPVWLLFVGMFVYTQGEVVTVLGENPYYSRRIPASHRGRVGGLKTVIASLFSTASQFGISAILNAADNDYSLIWIIYIACGVLTAILYACTYRRDKKIFPLLYE